MGQTLSVPVVLAGIVFLGSFRDSKPGEGVLGRR